MDDRGRGDRWKGDVGAIGRTVKMRANSDDGALNIGGTVMMGR